ncbi:MAG: hypothetical protein K9L78_05325, partial [Victivallales bacterium]|nr:hypothetical protein [Victivallales bacterium]
NEKTINGIKQKSNRSPFSVILFSRLITAFRFIAPIVIGLLKYNKIKFLIYDIIAVIIITVLLVFLGFCFGHAIESFFFKTKEYDIIIAGIIIVVYACFKYIRKFRKKR